MQKNSKDSSNHSIWCSKTHGYDHYHEFWTITEKMMTYNTNYAQFLCIMNIKGMQFFCTSSENVPPGLSSLYELNTEIVGMGEFVICILCITAFCREENDIQRWNCNDKIGFIIHFQHFKSQSLKKPKQLQILQKKLVCILPIQFRTSYN